MIRAKKYDECSRQECKLMAEFKNNFKEPGIEY